MVLEKVVGMWEWFEMVVDVFIIWYDVVLWVMFIFLWECVLFVYGFVEMLWEVLDDFYFCFWYFWVDWL